MEGLFSYSITRTQSGVNKHVRCVRLYLLVLAPVSLLPFGFRAAPCSLTDSHPLTPSSALAEPHP